MSNQPPTNFNPFAHLVYGVIVGCSKKNLHPRPQLLQDFFSIHRNCHSLQPQSITHTILYADDDYHASHITTACETDHTHVVCTRQTARDWLRSGPVAVLMYRKKKVNKEKKRGFPMHISWPIRAWMRLQPTHYVMIRQTHFGWLLLSCVLLVSLCGARSFCRPDWPNGPHVLGLLSVSHTPANTWTGPPPSVCMWRAEAESKYSQFCVADADNRSLRL